MRKQIQTLAYQTVIGALLLLSGTVTLLGGAAPAQAAINEQINLQSRVTDPSGNIVGDGTYNMEFKLMTVASGGDTTQGSCTTSCVWLETRTGGNKVTISRGLMSIQLGSVSSLSSVDFNQDLYISIRLGGTGTPGWDPEMSPRDRVGAAPTAIFSKNSDQFNGQNASYYLNAANLTGTLADARLSSNVPLKNAANDFTQSQTISNAGGKTTLALSNTGTDTGLTIGADTNLFRASANNLKTEDAFDAASYKVGGSSGATTTCSGGQFLQNQVVNGGITTGGTCASAGGGSATLQSAYDQTSGNTITTTSARDVDITLANTATDSNFVLDVASGSTSEFQVENNGTDVLQIGSAGQLQLDTTGSGGGLLLGGDTNLYRDNTDTIALGADDDLLIHGSNSDQMFFRSDANSAYLSYNLSDASDWIHVAQVFGDSDERFSTSTGGTMNWGPGNTAPDTNLYRSAANTLRTDDAFIATRLGNADPGSNLLQVQSSGTRYTSVPSDGTLLVRYDDNSQATGTIRQQNLNTDAGAGSQIRVDLSHDGSTATNASVIRTLKEQEWTATASTQDSALTFRTTADGTSSEAARLTSANQLQLPTTGSNAGLLLGGDANLYRDGADSLKTDDTFAAAAYKVGGTSGASTTCSGGQFLQNQVVNGGITTGGTCASAGGSSSLQGAYDGGNTIATAAGTGINVSAAAAPTADQFTVSNAGQAIATNNVENVAINSVGGSGAIEGGGLKVDFTPGGTSGSTWNGLKISANATGAASGVNENGIKLEGPSSPGSGTETAVNITSGWDIGIAIGSGGMELTNNGDPSTPASGKLRVYSKAVSGRSMLKAKGSSGVDYPLQPALFQQAITMQTPLTGATVASLGSTWTVDTTASTPAATQQYGLATNFATAATANDTTGVSENLVQHYRGDTANYTNGFFYVGRMAFPDANYGTGATGARTWRGLSNQTSAVMTNADNPAGHYAGFQFSTNRGDTNWQFMTKDNTTQNVIDTTMPFTVGKVYDFFVYTVPQGTTIYWRVDNLTDGTTQEGSTTANLPGATTSMRAGTGLQTLTTTARNMRVLKQYVESDQ